MLSRRALAEWGLLTAVLALLAGLAAWTEGFRRADDLLYDVGLGWSLRKPADDIVIVAIDEESLARIGRWPWRRAVHATLIDRLTAAGAAAVGIDVMFSEADASDPAGDRALADAMHRNGRVVLPVAQRTFGPALALEGTPLPPLASAANRLGHIDMALDDDGIARSIHLWAGLGRARHPQFALAMLQVAQPELAAAYPAPAEAPAGQPLSWQRDGRRYLPFAAPPGAYPTLSYVDVLSGAVPADGLRGKIVLVGATAAGLGDVYATPTSSTGRPMPGIEIQANALETLRNGDAVVRLAGGPVAAITALTLIVLMLALLRLSPRGGLLATALVLTMALAGSLSLLAGWHLWLPPVPLVIGTVLAYPLWSWRRLEAAQRYLDDELRQLRDSEPAALSSKPPAPSFDRLDQRIAIVHAATDRQHELRKARDETMRFLSHDLRSPLVSIIALVEGTGGPVITEFQARLNQIRRYAEKALDLADDFFRLAKAEAADPRRFIELDLATIVLEAADEAWAVAEKKKIAIQVHDACPGEALVLGDRSLLHRALLNLLDNAIRFGPERSPVRIDLRAADGSFEIAVSDEGSGVPAEFQDQLFTRFGRIPQPNQPPQAGVGLGLFIARTVAERHGGSAGHRSPPAGGATFFIRLPAADALCRGADIAPQ